MPCHALLRYAQDCRILNNVLMSVLRFTLLRAGLYSCPFTPHSYSPSLYPTLTPPSLHSHLAPLRYLERVQECKGLSQLLHSPDLVVPLTLALVCVCGDQVIQLAVKPQGTQQQQQQQQPGVAAGSSSAGMGGSSITSTNSSSSMDPWAVAEGVLLARAEQLQSAAAAAAAVPQCHLAVLQFCQEAQTALVAAVALPM